MHTKARTANNWSYCAAFTNLVKDAHPNTESAMPKRRVRTDSPEQVELLRYACDRFMGQVPEDKMVDNFINDSLRYWE